MAGHFFHVTPMKTPDNGRFWTAIASNGEYWNELYFRELALAEIMDQSDEDPEREFKAEDVLKAFKESRIIFEKDPPEAVREEMEELLEDLDEIENFLTPLAASKEMVNIAMG